MARKKKDGTESVRTTYTDRYFKAAGLTGWASASSGMADFEYTAQLYDPITIQRIEYTSPKIVRCSRCSAVCDEKTALEVGTCRNCGAPYPVLPSEIIVPDWEQEQPAVDTTEPRLEAETSTMMMWVGGIAIASIVALITFSLITIAIR